VKRYCSQDVTRNYFSSDFWRLGFFGLRMSSMECPVSGSQELYYSIRWLWRTRRVSQFWKCPTTTSYSISRSRTLVFNLRNMAFLSHKHHQWHHSLARLIDKLHSRGWWSKPTLFCRFVFQPGWRFRQPKYRDWVGSPPAENLHSSLFCLYATLTEQRAVALLVRMWVACNQKTLILSISFQTKVNCT
jgi:hypothetical protein